MDQKQNKLRTLQEMCSTCPFIPLRLHQLRDADYWHCVECHFRDHRFIELIEVEWDRARRVCIGYTNLSPADAQDIAQEYILKIVKISRDPSMWDGRPLKPWLNTILHHEIINHLRRNRNKPTALKFHSPDNEDHNGIPEPAAIGTEAIDPLLLEETRYQIEIALVETIKDPTSRKIVALSIEGFECIEIQQMLSVNAHAVWNARSRYFPRIRDKLREAQDE